MTSTAVAEVDWGALQEEDFGVFDDVCDMASDGAQARRGANAFFLLARENYVEGQWQLCLGFRVSALGAEQEPRKFLAVFQRNPRLPIRLRSDDGCIGIPLKDRKAVLSEKTPIGGIQHPVFVSIGEERETIEGVASLEVPSLVWLQSLDESPVVASAWDSIEGATPPLRGAEANVEDELSLREIDWEGPAHDIASVRLDQSDSAVIEGASEVVEEISNNRENAAGDWLQDLKIDLNLFVVALKANAIGITSNVSVPRRFQVFRMFVRPAQFCSGVV